MKGGYKITPGGLGFTIVEVMIFLAVSGIMFLVAANFISGKEAQAEYIQGMNYTAADIRTIINNVANGNYAVPSGGLNCTVDTSGVNVTKSRSSSSIGIPGCSLIGQAMVPGLGGNSYGLYTFAGCQFANCSSGISGLAYPTNFAQEEPTVVSFMTKPNIGWPGGLILKKILYVKPGSAISPIVINNAIGFMGSLPSINNQVLLSGSQPTTLVLLNRSALTSSFSVIKGSVLLCFMGSSTNLVGSIAIGSVNGGGQLTTTLNMGQGGYKKLGC